MHSYDLFEPLAVGTRKEPRPHQILSLKLLRDSLARGNKRVVLQLPVGAGKTITASEIAIGARRKGNKVAFTVPAISLVDQTVESFYSQGLYDIGVIQAGHPMTHYGMPVQVCSVQTLGRRFLPEADVVIVDECHLQFDVIREWMKDKPETVFIGLSATPWAKGMADFWQDLVCPVSMQELIDTGYLAPFRVYGPSHPDLSGVKDGADGDFKTKESSEVMSGKELISDVVESWLRLGEGLPTLVFAVDRAHAKKLQAEFSAVGVNMGYCDAFTELSERKKLFDQMARGEIAGIVNIGTLTTGVDADVRCVVLARPTKSEMLFVQMIGRALRTAPGKEYAVLIDHCDNHERMGFVTDIHHDKLLDGKTKRSRTKQEKGEPTPKACGSCGVMKPPKVHVCPSCGFKPERQSEIEVVDGTLVELKSSGKKPSPADKTEFYAQLLGWAQINGRPSRQADGKFKDRYGHWPAKKRGIVPMTPTPETLSWVKASNIRWAKRMGK